MLKKTKFTTIIIHIFNSTYTISCVIGVRPVLLSVDHRSRAALDNRKVGGFANIKYITLMYRVALVPLFQTYIGSNKKGAATYVHT